MKLTLQILDAGETFFRPLEERPLVVGSGDGADLRLSEAGVAPQHLRIEPDPEGGHRLVDLGTEGGTRINGRDVAQARLSIGDRIEIGAAVLVVGQHVQRKATPGDVLAEGRALSQAQAQLRSRRIQEEKPRRTGLIAGVALLALAVIAALYFGSNTSDPLPPGWGDLMRMRRVGDVEGARTLVARLRERWAGERQSRVAQLDAVAADLAAIEIGVRDGAVELRAEASTRSTAEQLDDLRARRERDEDSVDAIVARVLSTRLRDIREGVLPEQPAPPQVAKEDPKVDPPLKPVESPKVPEAAVKTQPGAPEVVTTNGERRNGSADGSVESGLIAEQVASIDRLRGEKRFAEAYELCALTLAGVDAGQAGALREAESRLRADAERELGTLLKQVDGLAAAAPDPTHPTSSLEAALLALHEGSLRFPSDGPFAQLRERRRQFENGVIEIRRRGEGPVHGASLTEVRDRLADARAAERDGDYARASALLTQIAGMVASTDAAYGQSLTGRAADLDRLAALTSFLREELAAGRAVRLRTEDGSDIDLTLRDQHLLLGDGPFGFAAITADSLAALVRSRKASPVLCVAAAIVAYRAADPALAESLLGEAVQKQKDLQPQVDGVIARGRGETADSAGYRLVNGAFVAAREVEARAHAKELMPVIARIARTTGERREKELETLLQKGPRELDAVVIALRDSVVETATRIERDAFRRHYDALAETRRKLDDARTYAKELIFDEVKYFYPYKPPAVSAEKASEYWKVQGEVDERVAALRNLWTQKGPSKRVPKPLIDTLDGLDWMQKTLAGFGERVPEVEDRVAWLRAVPVDQPLELHTFAWDEGELARHEEDRRIVAYDQKVASSLSAPERDIVELTNDYRIMFGHRALAVNPKLLAAARGHAQEMGKMGYFSHFSPIPEHRTPFDRMKLAGYGAGVGENIANYPTAPSAQDGWLHSSGHHRNLLSPSHREFACGNDGRIWVENFGRGDEYLEDPVFRAIK